MPFVTLMWSDLEMLRDEGQCAVMLADAIKSSSVELPDLLISMFLMELIDTRKGIDAEHPVDPYEYVRLLRNLATECLHDNGEE